MFENCARHAHTLYMTVAEFDGMHLNDDNTKYTMLVREYKFAVTEAQDTVYLTKVILQEMQNYFDYVRLEPQLDCEPLFFLIDSGNHMYYSVITRIENHPGKK